MINYEKNRFAEKIIPFLILGISVAISVAALILFAYLFVWGVLIGFVLWGLAALKEKFFSSSKHGRVIDMGE